MPQFKYIQLHVESGKRMEHGAEFSSKQDFLRHLNNWNRLGHGSWLYYSVDVIPPILPAAWIRKMDKKLPSQQEIELDQLASTGIWSKDGVDRPDRDDYKPGEGC